MSSQRKFATRALQSTALLVDETRVIRASSTSAASSTHRCTTSALCPEPMPTTLETISLKSASSLAITRYLFSESAGKLSVCRSTACTAIETRLKLSLSSVDRVAPGEPPVASRLAQAADI
ncbi:hypothetical protein CERSUDRAFT_85297, partial [Gelatoporia subvermispora B]